MIRNSAKQDNALIEEMKANEPQHGDLINISYSSYTGGMMFNSDSRNSYTLNKYSGEWVLTVVNKIPFGVETTTAYRVGEDAIKELNDVVRRGELAAFDGLKYVNEFQVTDYSSGCSISMCFDDRSVGGAPFVNRNVNVDALRQNGLESIADEVLKKLISVSAKGELISQTERDPAAGSNIMGMGMGMGTGTAAPPAAPGSATPATATPAPAVPGAWVCRECGCNTNMGKFCTECGSRREDQ